MASNNINQDIKIQSSLHQTRDVHYPTFLKQLYEPYCTLLYMHRFIRPLNIKTGYRSKVTLHGKFTTTCYFSAASVQRTEVTAGC